MNNYRVVEDLNFFGRIIAKKGDVFSPNEGGKYILLDYEMTEDVIKSDPHFEIFNENIEIKVTELSQPDLDEVKTWRLQLDVTTTKRKLMEIEPVLRDSISHILSCE